MDIVCDLRAAREGDAEAVSEVIISALRETNAKDYPPEVIARVERNFSPAAVLELMGRRKVFVAVAGERQEHKARIVGTASLEGGAVRTMFVAPDMQRRGVGRRLMAEVERAAREAGLMTLVVPSSVTAEPFYAGLGFKAVRDQYYSEERTIIMERALTPVP
jgi:GNAT superfamily N-acetyltransferase